MGKGGHHLLALGLECLMPRRPKSSTASAWREAAAAMALTSSTKVAGGKGAAVVALLLDELDERGERLVGARANEQHGSARGVRGRPAGRPDLLEDLQRAASGGRPVEKGVF